MRRFLAISCVSILLLPAVARAQHEDHAAMKPDQIGSGTVKFQTSCGAAVAAEFNNAVALLHSFWFPEATKLFEAIAQKDSSCALAHWGIAMSNWGNPYGGIRAKDVIGARSRAHRRGGDPL